MAESSSSSDSDRPGSPSIARTGPKSSRTFVWLRELPKAIPRGRPWDELNREGRVKEIEFGKKFNERHMRDKLKEHFPELAQADFTRIRLYKSGSRGSILKKVAKSVPDAAQLLQKFKGGTSKRVYIILKNDDENGERPNSGNEAAASPATQGRPNGVVPRDAERSNSGNQTGAASATHRRPNAVVPRDADAETDAKEDEEDKIEEDEKNDGNNEGPDTSLERKKRK